MSILKVSISEETNEEEAKKDFFLLYNKPRKTSANFSVIICNILIL